MTPDAAQTPEPETPRAFTRSMRVTGVLFLALSAVTPASSVFVIIPGIVSQAGTGAVIALAAAALVALAMALVYSELASAFPHAGGEYALLGRTLGPFVGFVYMGVNLVGSTLAPAVLSLGASDYVSAVWPGVQSLPLGVGIVAFAMLLSLLNIRLNAWVTGLFLLVEMLALVVLTALGFFHAHRPLADLILHPVVLSPPGASHGGHLAPTPIGMIGLATAVAIFAYNGFGSAVYFSEEMHEAPRLIWRAILLALVLTVVFEFVPVLAVLLGAPDLPHVLASASPFSDFLKSAGGGALGLVVSLGIALAIVNAVIATVLINARFLFSSGRDGVWHGAANDALTRIHGRFKSPWAATLLAGVSAGAACFIPFHILLVMNGTAVVVMYLLLCLGAIAGRLTGSTAHAPYRMPLYPLAPVFGVAALAYVIYANWIDPDVGRPSLLVTVALMVVSCAYFLILRGRRGVPIVLKGPAEEAGD
jgi:amino acid transporter